MQTSETPTQRLACSFCGKYQEEVRKLVAGPDVFICDECVCLSLKIISDDAYLRSAWFCFKLVAMITYPFALFRDKMSRRTSRGRG